MRKLLSWLIVILFFILVISINTTKIDMTGGLDEFFDLSKWEDVTYWVQLISNTLFLVILYSTVLVTRKNRLIDENDDINKERVKLQNNKDKIITGNKRAVLDDYLELITNTDDKLKHRLYKLEVKRKRYYIMRMKKAIVRLDEEIERITKYRTALRSDIEQLKNIDLNVHAIGSSKKPVTFDTLFDIMDYTKPNKEITIGYSDTAEARKLIAKSPLSSVTTVFLSILAFGNILVINSDWKSVVLIMGAVSVAALLKLYNAVKDAEGIARNKLRALRKANDEIETFMSYDVACLKKIRDTLLQVNEKLEEPKNELLPALKKDVHNWDDILTIGPALDLV